jgi:hypothetical protein
VNEVTYLTISDMKTIETIDYETKIARLESGNTGYEELLVRKLLKNPNIEKIMIAAMTSPRLLYHF